MRRVELDSGALRPGRSLALAILVVADMRPGDEGLTVTSSAADWVHRDRSATVRVDSRGVTAILHLRGDDGVWGYVSSSTASHGPRALAALLADVVLWLDDGVPSEGAHR